MTREAVLHADLARVGEALSARTEELRLFIGEFFPKLLAVETSPEGQAALVSVLVKQAVAPFYHAFPSLAPRHALLEALDQMLTSMRSAGPETLQ